MLNVKILWKISCTSGRGDGRHEIKEVYKLKVKIGKFISIVHKIYIHDFHEIFMYFLDKSIIFVRIPEGVFKGDKTFKLLKLFSERIEKFRVHNRVTKIREYKDLLEI